MSDGSYVYSPLPQSNSESDEFSEEELHSSAERQNVMSRKTKLPNQIRPEIILNVNKTKVTNYKQLDTDRDLGTTLNGLQLETNKFTVVEPEVKIENFSPTRKICFAFSISLCVFTTVIFLWILPCEIGPCPPGPSSLPKFWKTELYSIELRGPINIVPNSWDKNQNLIFLFRNSFSRVGDETRFPSEDGGIISLLGGDGDISWWFILKREPKKLSCDLIDVNRDGIKDCIVAGRNNLLKAVQALPGIKVWDIHSSAKASLKQCDIELPIVTNDINGDGVKDLLTTCNIVPRHKEKHISVSQSYFLLVSGKSGAVIGKPVEIPNCSAIHNFTLTKEEQIVSYECSDAGGKELVKDKIDLKMIGPLVGKNVNFGQGDVRRSRNAIIDEERIFYADGVSLSLDNFGHCPENCKMVVTVKDEESGKNHTLHSLENAYGMIPVTLKVGQVNGFVFKYWEWHPRRDKDVESELRKSVTTRNSVVIDDKNMKSEKPLRRLVEPCYLERDILLEPLKESKRTKRTSRRIMNRRVLLPGSYFREANFTIHEITERIVFIIRNETDDLRVINSSQVFITQMCKDSVCQPDPLFQKHSLLITDLYRSNIQNLISYTSYFVNRSQEGSTPDDITWELESMVRVSILDAKLFDSET